MDIKSRIKERGQTVSGVAKRMGITKSALSQTINGNPTFDKLCEIAEILGISVSDLVSDDESKTITCPRCGTRLLVTEIQTT